MEIAATTNTAPSTAASGRIGLADNFDNFLKLLTTQL
jgi:flagellar hook assembly protein FlgD